MITKILLPTDGSEQAEKTIQYAIDLAKLSGAAVIAMHAYSSPALLRKRSAAMIDEFRSSLEEEAREILAEVTERIQAAGLAVSALAVEGPPAEAILRAVDEEQPDLIVMGSRGSSSLPGILIGSVAERVVRQASIPVLVVK